jgi:23S rRNA (uracil1939-C5)-methyltransferase
VAQPLCRHFGPCGGCDWQDLSYPDQLARKKRTLEDLFHASLGRLAPPVQPVLGMPPDETGWPWRFRHKASFVFGDTDGRLTIGHYAARSHRVVPIVECPVHSDRANRIAFALHEQLARARIPAAGADLTGLLRHLLVRTTSDGRQAAAMLVVTHNHKALRTPIRKFLAGPDAPTGFFLNVHDRPGPYMIGRETIRLEGHPHVREQIAGIKFLVSPTAFFQTNAIVAATLVDLVLAHAPAEPSLQIADLYSGSGLFTLPLAARGHRVTAIEENARAVEDGQANARLNRLEDRVRFHRGRLEEAIPRLGRSQWDLAVIDPPRDGCPPDVLHRLLREMRPPAVVYVSCNPEALAGELPVMLDAGYSVRRVQPVDMFPHTTHIETVVRLIGDRGSGIRSGIRDQGSGIRGQGSGPVAARR